MDCPTCHNAMITLELADVEIDHCTSCGGIWLDSGELELLLDDPAQAKRLLSSFQQSGSATEHASQVSHLRQENGKSRCWAVRSSF